MKEQDPEINYTREAFLHPLNLTVLFVSALTAFFLSDMGSVSNLVLTMAFGTELVYLGIVPRLPRFKQRVKMRKIRNRDKEEEEKLIFQQLDSRSRKKFIVLKHLSKMIKQNFDKLPYTSQGLLDNIRKKIEELLSNYITLLDQYKRYEIYMNSAVEAGLKQEVERIRQKMSELTSERLKNTKARRLQILQKRLKKFEIAKEKYLVCETHLETIEDAIRYIYEQSMTMNNAEEIGFQLDNLLNDVEETSQLIDDLDREILPSYEGFESEIDLGLEPSVTDTDEEAPEPTPSKVNRKTNE
ncbi:MAG: hypothetical protein WD035_10505 [Balneolaceae bacterium]